MTGSTIFHTPQGLQAKCWVNNQWILFRLVLGTYTNFITFLDAHKLSFLETTIPFFYFKINL